MNKILPRPSKSSEPYWQGCRERVLRLQRCHGCQRYQFYPRNLCSHCGHRDLDWCEASGRGTVASFTVVRQGISTAYPAPYIVALVDLEEGPRMMSNLVDVEPRAVAVGAPVTVDFSAWADDFAMPVFRLDQQEQET